MGKNCMNCMRMVPVYDGARRDGQKCQLDPDMRVNGRMCCEAWLSNDLGTEAGRSARPFVGSISVSCMTTEKKR